MTYSSWTVAVAVVALASSSWLPLIDAGKVSSTVKVQLPKELSRSSGYDHREALFGIPPYGASIQQNVIYTEDSLCAATLPKEHWKPPFFLMVSRGECTFVQKARNAQHAGAAAVIIADNQCQCKHDKICTPEEGTSCEKHEPLMADDGSGYDITIPAVLLFKQDADPIIAALKKKKTVRMELSWTLPNPDDHVEWDLWTSPTDAVSEEFKADFKEAALALASRVTFTPHMYIYDGIEAKCRNDEGENICYSMCTNNGRYCATDPDGDLDSGISGADVVAESLRRLCIWEVFGDPKNGGDGIEWWDYNRVFENTCASPDKFTDEACIREAMTFAGIDFDSIEECTQLHGGLDSSDVNDMLEKQLDDKEKGGIVIMPVAYVNGVPVRGALEFATIFKALCAGFKAGTQPTVCEKCANCSNEKQCVVNGGRCVDAKGISITAFIGSLGAVALVFALIGTVLYQRQQREMHDQVRSVMKEYMPVEMNGLNAMVVTADDDDDDEGDANGTFT